MTAKPERILEVVGALLYCAFMYQQITGEGDMTYARILHTSARTFQRIAQFFGAAGIRAEQAYWRAIEAERMN